MAWAISRPPECDPGRPTGSNFPPPTRLQPDALRLLSELCSDEEAQRRVVEEAGALPRIAASLAPDREQEERAAAVHLVRVLSRSTKLLRCV